MADLEVDDNSQDPVQEKVKEFSSIIHTIRHDLRNFIAAIEGYTYLLKEEFNEDYLTRIFSNINNITELVDRSVLLVDSELKMEKISEINLNVLVKTCMDVIPGSVTFESDELPTVEGDYSKILFVFKALLENAVKHAEPKTIAIRKQETKDSSIVLAFINDGKKLEEEKVQKLLNQIPQSLKPNGGFSLITTKKILQTHGWEISFKREEDGKSCFEITIPPKSVIK